VKDFCQQHRVDLVICGNHNQSLFSRATCSAKDIVGSSGVDVLLVSWKKASAESANRDLSGEFGEGRDLARKWLSSLRGSICCRSAINRSCQR
jgi:hypothetical protein